MIPKRTSWLFILVLGLTTAAAAQRTVSHRANPDVRLSKKQSTFYVTFKGEDNGRVWLRLHNNTKWAITIPTEESYFDDKCVYKMTGGYPVLCMPQGMKAEIRYSIEQDGQMLSVKSGTVCTSVLLPGRYVEFSVLRDHVSNKRSVLIPFQYEWEAGNGYSGESDPVHWIRAQEKVLTKRSP